MRGQRKNPTMIMRWKDLQTKAKWNVCTDTAKVLTLRFIFFVINHTQQKRSNQTVQAFEEIYSKLEKGEIKSNGRPKYQK